MGNEIMKNKNIKNKNLKLIRNNRADVTVLLVVVIGISILTLLSSIYIYTTNRSKYLMQIRNNYQMIAVMESLAKQIRTAVDAGTAMEFSAAVGCPAGTNQVNMGSQVVCLPAQFCAVREDTGENICMNAAAVLNVNSQDQNMEFYVQLDKKDPSFIARWKQSMEKHFRSSIDHNKMMKAYSFLRKDMDQNFLKDHFVKHAMATTYHNLPIGAGSLNPVDVANQILVDACSASSGGSAMVRAGGTSRCVSCNLGSGNLCGSGVVATENNRIYRQIFHMVWKN